MNKDCETCKDFCSCGCDDLRERAYLRREGKDCYSQYDQEAVKTPSYAEIYEAENAWEDRISSYRCH